MRGIPFSAVVVSIERSVLFPTFICQGQCQFAPALVLVAFCSLRGPVPGNGPAGPKFHKPSVLQRAFDYDPAVSLKAVGKHVPYLIEPEGIAHGSECLGYNS